MNHRYKVSLISDDLTVPGYEVVHSYVRHATNDLDLCYRLGKLLDQRRDAILALTKALENNDNEKGTS